MGKVKIFGLVLMVVLLTAAGCGGTENAKSEKKEAETADSGQKEETALEEAETADFAPEEDSSMADAQIEAEGSSYTWQEVTVTLPSNWVGHCTITEQEDGFYIYQTASYEKDSESRDAGMGYICGLFRTDNILEQGMGERMIACTQAGQFYYLIFPTDVACDTEDGDISKEYIRMCDEAQILGSAIEIDGEVCHAEEYVFPASSILPLEREKLADMSDNNLWIAKNEIYARHGRQFDSSFLQQYFNQCSWYEGKVPADEFDDSGLTQLEKDNISMLQDAQDDYKNRHPYPKKYAAREVVHEDLDGDGDPEEIIYQPNGADDCTLTVNGTVWNVQEAVGYLETPMADCFYITDILENDGALEIAILDEGASEDFATYFFRQEGEDSVSYMGTVSGFPFAEYNNGINGFDGMGNVTGRVRMDLMETVYLDGIYRYNQDIQWISYDSAFLHDMRPSRSHVLYEDLPVYFAPDKESSMAVIPAQEQVFFLASDMYQWILVKGKDGKKGYMLLEDGKVADLEKPAEEVFSDLYYAD